MSQLLVNAVVAGSLAALIAGGLALVYGVLGFFNLALGQFALIAGYAAWWLSNEAGAPLPLAVVVGLLTVAMVTWIVFEVAINPFYRHHRFLPIVTTIAASMILDGIILLLFGERSRAIVGAKHFLGAAGMRFSLEQIFLVGGTIMLMSAVAYVLQCTRFGRQIRASVQHREAAGSLGISASVLHRVLFIGSGVLAGAGGLFIGIDQVLMPSLCFPLTIKAYAALIAGGKDNLWGTILCAYLIALVEQLAVGLPWFGGQYIPASYQSVVALLFIILILLFKPAGLFTRASRQA